MAKSKEEINELREKTRETLLSKFGDIVFEEIPHRYTIHGVEYTPVSTIIEHYTNEFDEDARSKSTALKTGRTQEEVLREWKYTNRCSIILGSRTHEYGESYTNLMSGHKELICEQNKPQYLEEENWLIPTFPQEFAVKDFYDTKPKELIPIGAEFKLSTQYIDGAKPICGTADILFYYNAQREEDSGFVVGDWKTNRELTKSFIRNTGIMMLPPFDNMYDEALSHYYLQFNLYQRMMESVGLNIIARRLIHLKRDGTFEVHKVPKIDDNIINQVIME